MENKEIKKILKRDNWMNNKRLYLKGITQKANNHKCKDNYEKILLEERNKNKKEFERMRDKFDYLLERYNGTYKQDFIENLESWYYEKGYLTEKQLNHLNKLF